MTVQYNKPDILWSKQMIFIFHWKRHCTFVPVKNVHFMRKKLFFVHIINWNIKSRFLKEAFAKRTISKNVLKINFSCFRLPKEVKKTLKSLFYKRLENTLRLVRSIFLYLLFWLHCLHAYRIVNYFMEDTFIGTEKYFPVFVLYNSRFLSFIYLSEYFRFRY